LVILTEYLIGIISLYIWYLLLNFFFSASSYFSFTVHLWVLISLKLNRKVSNFENVLRVCQTYSTTCLIICMRGNAPSRADRIRQMDQLRRAFTYTYTYTHTHILYIWTYIHIYIRYIYPILGMLYWKSYLAWHTFVLCMFFSIVANAVLQRLRIISKNICRVSK